MTPDDIKYVVVSHMHLDHGGNVAKFPNSTLIMQKDEIEYAFWPAEPYTGTRTSRAMLCPARRHRAAQAQRDEDGQLRGDMDIFGDGSVIVKRWAGPHRWQPDDAGTPAKNRTDRSSPATTSTSARTSRRACRPISCSPTIPAGIMRAYEWIRYMMATEKADFFTAHDPDAFKAMKKAPEYYE